MAVFKFTMLFSQLSAASAPNYPIHRIGGWSESWYVNGTAASDVISRASLSGIGLMDGRAALLGKGASIVGFRVQQVSPIGPTQSGAVAKSGRSGDMNDAPQIAMLCKAPGQGVNNIRRFVLRGFPKGQTQEGEYSPTADFDSALKSFFSISLGSWNFRARDLSQTTFKVINISATGLITTQVAVNIAPLSMVRVLKSLDSGKNLRGGLFQVTAIPAPNQIQLLNWPFGATTGGSVRVDAVVYPQVDTVNTNYVRIVTRRVGRPFTAYRGRRAKRR